MLVMLPRQIFGPVACLSEARDQRLQFSARVEQIVLVICSRGGACLIVSRLTHRPIRVCLAVAFYERLKLFTNRPRLVRIICVWRCWRRARRRAWRPFCDLNCRRVPWTRRRLGLHQRAKLDLACSQLLRTLAGTQAEPRSGQREWTARGDLRCSCIYPASTGDLCC